MGATLLQFQKFVYIHIHRNWSMQHPTSANVLEHRLWGAHGWKWEVVRDALANYHSSLPLFFLCPVTFILSPLILACLVTLTQPLPITLFHFPSNSTWSNPRHPPTYLQLCTWNQSQYLSQSATLTDWWFPYDQVSDFLVSFILSVTGPVWVSPVSGIWTFVWSPCWWTWSALWITLLHLLLSAFFASHLNR